MQTHFVSTWFITKLKGEKIQSKYDAFSFINRYKFRDLTEWRFKLWLNIQLISADIQQFQRTRPSYDRNTLGIFEILTESFFLITLVEWVSQGESYARQFLNSWGRAVTTWGDLFRIVLWRVEKDVSKIVCCQIDVL